MAPRLCKFFKFLLSLNSQKRLEYKENNTKYRSLTRKPRSHVRILIYRTWPIGNELIVSVQSLNIQLSRASFPGLHVWLNLGYYSFRFWSITRNEILLSSMLNVHSKGILTDIIHGCSGVTYPYLMKEDFFSLRIFHENSLRLPYSTSNL